MLFYYKMQQKLITNSVTFFVLQNAAVLLKDATVITKCVNTQDKTDIYFREFMKDKTLHY